MQSWKSPIATIGALVLLLGILTVSDRVLMPSTEKAGAPQDQSDGLLSPQRLPDAATDQNGQDSEEASPDIAINALLLPSERSVSQRLREIREDILGTAIGSDDDVLLFTGNGFIITYVPPIETFIVTINREPTDRARGEAQHWFLGFGLDQADLCDLPVRFLLQGADLRAAHPDFTSLPDGCAMPQ